MPRKKATPSGFKQPPSATKKSGYSAVAKRPTVTTMDPVKPKRRTKPYVGDMINAGTNPGRPTAVKRPPATAKPPMITSPVLRDRRMTPVNPPMKTSPVLRDRRMTPVNPGAQPGRTPIISRGNSTATGPYGTTGGFTKSSSKSFTNLAQSNGKSFMGENSGFKRLPVGIAGGSTTRTITPVPKFGTKPGGSNTKTITPVPKFGTKPKAGGNSSMVKPVTPVGSFMKKKRG